jgi:hypothetical protein
VERTEAPVQREQLARRLELVELRVEADRITGQVKGCEVVLEGEPPFHALQVKLNARLPLVSLVMRHGDLNHSEAVETGDVAFDEAMQVVAEPTFVPTIARLLSHAELRDTITRFLTRFPDSVLTADTLHVKSEQPISQSTVLDAVALVNTIAARFAEHAFLEQEEPPALPDDADTVDPHLTVADRLKELRGTVLVVVGSLWAMHWALHWPLALCVTGTVVAAGVGLWRAWVLAKKA